MEHHAHNHSHQHAHHSHADHSHHDHGHHGDSDHGDHKSSVKSGQEHHHHEDHSGHAGHHEGMINDFRKRFYYTVVLTVPLLVLSPMIQRGLGFEFSFPGSRYVLFALASVIFFYGGWPFLKGLADEMKTKNPGMMTLIAVAISVAYLYSSAVVFGLEGMDFFWELATLIAIMLVGHWIEMKSVVGASNALQLLVKMIPSEAHRLDGETVTDVPVDALNAGDLILVKSNEKFPADGVISEGESHIDQSMLTGESEPVRKGKGDKVIGGSVNGNQSLKVKIQKTGKESYLNKVIGMVREAQKAKSKTQNLANKAARWLTIIAIAAGFITLIAWLLSGEEFSYAIERMVTVMVITCPHALGLAIPLVVAISTSVSARKGLLIRNRTAFENARKITAVIFDKTGTLTEGKFGVARYDSFTDQVTRHEMLTRAASLEQHSEHPIAKGILAKAREKNGDLSRVERFESITGQGVQGSIGGETWKVVSPGYLEGQSIALPDTGASDEAETIVYVLKSETPIGYIALSDKVREESMPAIQLLRENRIKVYMATGDNERTAKAVSEKLKLDNFYYEVLPHEKVKIVEDLQRAGEFVAMTGDGVNDAPALAKANIGIAVGSGTDVAAETADIILVNSNPRDIVNLILFGKATYKKMVQNLVWATGYNAITLPLATGFISGLVISPAIGAVFMSLSTVVVAINAQLLKLR